MTEAARDRASSAAGRPLGFDRSTVITDATATFWERGYEATSIATLEIATGLSRSSLTNTFGSKHDLLLACLDVYLEAVDQELVRPLRDPSIPGLDAVEEFFVRLDRLKRAEPGSHGCLIVNAVADFGDADPDVSRRVSRYQRLLHDGFAAALRRARHEGHVCEAVPSDSARTLVGLAVAINIAARANQADGSSAQLARAARHLVASWRSER